MKKCKYYQDKPTTVYNKELLCERHCNIIYGITKVEQLSAVPKVKKEISLNRKYIKIMDNLNMYKKEELDKIVFKFNMDVKAVKKINYIYIVVFMLFTSISFSQPYVSAGFDVRNAIVGSEATQNRLKLDYIIRFGMIGSIPNHTTVLEGQIGYERFEAIDFDRFFFGIGTYLYPFKNITLVPIIEPSLIGRWNDWGGGLGEIQQKSSHLTIGISLAVRYEVSHHISLELQSCLLPRTDLNAMYGGANYIVNNSFSILYRL